MKSTEEVDKFDLLFDVDRIKHSAESKHHYEKKKEVANKLLDKDYKVYVESTLTGKYIMDVLAFKDGYTKAIEVGRTESKKLEFLNNRVDEVKHVPYYDGAKRVKEVRTSNNEDIIYCYIIPIMSSGPAYQVEEKGKVYLSKHIDNNYILIQDGAISNFHRQSIPVDYYELDDDSLENEDELSDLDIETIIDRHRKD